MSVIVTDAGFAADDWQAGFAPVGEAAPGQGIDLPQDTAPADIGAAHLAAPAIRVAFPAFSDGRGFTLARHLRDLGYTGRLRASGHVIADQYAMARRVGFDEVEISDDLAARQTEEQWHFRSDWQARDYQRRLRG